MVAADPPARLLHWLRTAALPFAQGRGTDPAGGFFERFAVDGSAIDDPRRARVAARQLYVAATAHRLGWADTRPMLAHATAALDRHLGGDDGIVTPTIAPNGAAIRSGFDLYDQAFVLFGLAAAAVVGVEPGADRARLLYRRMRSGWGHPVAGFEEASPRTLPLKANPHMHMLEAALAWAAIDPSGGWDDLADELIDLCLRCFIDPATGTVREYYDGNWTAIDTPGHDVVEPGHQYEWAWLLIRWGTLRGRADAVAAARRMIAVTERHGVSAGPGLAVNGLDRGLRICDARHRLWPQTERIKAHVALAAIARDPAERDAATATAAAATGGLLRFFDHPVPGSWWEHLDPDGVAIPEPARLSSLYHIACAAAVLAGDA